MKRAVARRDVMTKILMDDLNSLADKLSALKLSEGEAAALNALVTSSGEDDEVAGFQRGGQQAFTGPGLAGTLTGSGLYSMAGAGTELFSMAGAGTELFSASAAGTEFRQPGST